MPPIIKKAFQASLFFSIGFFIFYLVYDKQNKAYQEECRLRQIPGGDCSLVEKVMTDIGNADYRWVALIVFLFLITNVIRTLRWRMMFEGINYHPGYINLFGSIMINYLANLGVPRSGEIIRAGLITNYEDIPLEKVLGTIFTDRIFDVFCLAIVLLLTMILGGNDVYQYLNKNIDLGSKLSVFSNNPALWIILSFAVIATMFWGYSYRKRLLKTSIGERIWFRVKGFLDGMNSVRTVSSIPLFLFYTALIWVLYYFMMYLSFFAFEPTAHLGPVAGLVVFAFGSLGILFPSPGGMGSYHMMVSEGLTMYGVSGSNGFSFANIIFFTVSVGINILLGILFLILLPILNNREKTNKNVTYNP